MSAPGEIARGVLDGGTVRVVVALTTAAAREAARRHGARGAAAVALARGTTAGLLLSTLTKDQERVTLQILGDGPFGGLTVDASSSGRVRAYLKNPAVRLPLDAAGDAPRASLAAGIGATGLVSVVRDLGLRETFSGQTALASGEIDEDVERYLTESEQIASALSCDARLPGGAGAAAHADAGGDGGLAIAGGILVQALPGSEGAALVEATRARLRGGALTRALDERPVTAEALARAVLGATGASLQLLDSRPVTFHCPCSRERAMTSLALLGAAELRAMILDDGKADVTCNFCRERYQFSEADLETIRREVAGQTGAPS